MVRRRGRNGWKVHVGSPLARSTAGCIEEERFVMGIYQVPSVCLGSPHLMTLKHRQGPGRGEICPQPYSFSTKRGACRSYASHCQPSLRHRRRNPLMCCQESRPKEMGMDVLSGIVGCLIQWPRAMSVTAMPSRRNLRDMPKHRTSCPRARARVWNLLIKKAS